MRLWRFSLRLIFPHSTPFALKYGKLKVVFFKIHPSFPHKAWKARAFFFTATVKLKFPNKASHGLTPCLALCFVFCFLRLNFRGFTEPSGLIKLGGPVLVPGVFNSHDGAASLSRLLCIYSGQSHSKSFLKCDGRLLAV